jgi:hypothetical protein
MDGSRSTYSERTVYRVTVGKPGGKRRLGRIRRRWRIMLKYVKEIGLRRAYWLTICTGACCCDYGDGIYSTVLAENCYSCGTVSYPTRQCST